jgi:hypothetical protein
MDGEMVEKLDQGKFIVINRKRFVELRTLGQAGGDAVFKLEKAIMSFAEDYRRLVNKHLNQMYIVCNQDEPYADEVAGVILKNDRGH